MLFDAQIISAVNLGDEGNDPDAGRFPRVHAHTFRQGQRSDPRALDVRRRLHHHDRRRAYRHERHNADHHCCFCSWTSAIIFNAPLMRVEVEPPAMTPLDIAIVGDRLLRQ